jgi:HNH endonuclease
MRQKVLERFLSKVIRTEHGCWLWIGAKVPKGYGQFKIGEKVYRAHRVAYELFKEEVPEGMFVLHSCDNPSCVNPDHLFVGTNSDNIQDSFDKGRSSNVGELHPGHKLTEDDVLHILGSDKSNEELAAEYDVDRASIYKIRTGRSWSYMRDRRDKIMEDL